MNIRKAQKADLPIILCVYKFAKDFMRLNGNPTQWGDDYPNKECILRDIEKQNCYIVLRNNEIVGIFTFFIGTEPNYENIYDGQWLNNLPYGVIHRLASNGKTKGVFNSVIDYCLTKCDNIRIDTHQNNKIMQHLISKYGFLKCGKIFVEDGTPRIAYQLKK